MTTYLPYIAAYTFTLILIAVLCGMKIERVLTAKKHANELENAEATGWLKRNEQQVAYEKSRRESQDQRGQAFSSEAQIRGVT